MKRLEGETTYSDAQIPAQESKIPKSQVNTTLLRETKMAPITDPKEIGCL